MKEPGNLQAIVGKKYKVVLEESGKHETPENKKADRLWLEVIPCAGGRIIYLKSLGPPVKLALFGTIRKVASIFEQLGSADWTLTRLDGEAIVVFPATMIDKVAPLAGAKRKITRTLSPEAKEKLIEAGKKYRLKGKNEKS